MKAAVLEAPDSTPVYRDFPEPPIGGETELVELVAAGIHPVVRSLAMGRHYGSTGEWPQIPGVDAVARTADGQLIYTGFVAAPYGTFAERMAVPAGMRLALPAGADPVQVAAGLNPGLASWMPLRARVDEAGTLKTVLILGATGTAGQLAVENAFALGAERVVAAGRDPQRLRAVETAGAHPVRLRGELEADAEAIAAALDGRAPTLVLDFVWGGPAEAAFAALGRRGLGEDDSDISYVEIGSLAGVEAAVPAALLRSRRFRLTGSGAGSASIASITAELPDYMRLIADGRVTVPTAAYPLAQIASAWDASAGAGTRAVVVPA